MERRFIKLREIDATSLNARWPVKLAGLDHPTEVDLFSDTLEKDFPNLITDEWISFDDLVQSVRETGLLQDPHVMELPEPRPTGERYRLLYGFRRTRAFWAAAGENLDAGLWVMVHPPMSEATIRLLQLTENYHRQNMDFAADIEAVRALSEDDGLSERQIAQKLGISNGKAHSYVALGRLLKKYDSLKALVDGGALGYSQLAEIEQTLRKMAGDGYQKLGKNRHDFIDDRLRDVVDYFVETVDQTFQEYDGKPPRGAIRSQLSLIKKRLKSPEAEKHLNEAITRRQTLLLQADYVPETEGVLIDGGFAEEHLNLKGLPEPAQPTEEELRSRRVEAWAKLTEKLLSEDWSLMSDDDLVQLRMIATAIDQKLTLLTATPLDLGGIDQR